MSSTQIDHHALLTDLARVLTTLPPQLPRDIAEWKLSQLREVERIVEGVTKLVDENACLVDEVLQGYENLNLVFDLAQNLATITDRVQLERQLLSRVCHLLKARMACIVDGRYPPRWYEASGFRPESDGGDSASDASSSFARIADEVVNRLAVKTCEQRKLDVTTVEEYQVLSGPLIRLDDRVDAMLAFRRSSAGPFTSSETLMVETALSFGSRVICNTEAHERLRRMSIEVSRALVAAIDKKDHYTCGHSERVALLARATGAALGLPPDELQILEWAGLLHDVGKIGIPEAILCKPGRLTEDEFNLIKEHPRMGYEILRPIASFDRVLEAVLYHHEQPDGRGYPEGLKRDEIPLLARIVHVVDVFDALTSTRSYRGAFTVEQAIEIIQKDCGTKVDTDVAVAFERAITAFEEESPDEFKRLFRSDGKAELEST